MRAIGYILGVVIGAPLVFFIYSIVFLKPREVSEQQVQDFVANSVQVTITKVPWIASFHEPKPDERLGIKTLSKKTSITRRHINYIKANTYTFYSEELQKYVRAFWMSEGDYIRSEMLAFCKEGKDENEYPNVYFYYHKDQFTDPLFGTIENPLPILHMVSTNPRLRSMRDDNKDSDTVYLAEKHLKNVFYYLSYFIEDEEFERLYPESN